MSVKDLLYDCRHVMLGNLEPLHTHVKDLLCDCCRVMLAYVQPEGVNFPL